MRRGAVAIALVLAACGGGEASPVTDPAPATSTTVAPSAPSTTTLATTTTTSPVPPAVLSLASGRGDDDTFEVAIWFASDPFEPERHRIVVGADVDGSYPGVGDPYPHLDGHLELTPAGAALKLADAVIAEGDAITELVSWGSVDGVLRVFFIETPPARGGTTWVVVEAAGERVTFGTAGAPFGTACSYHSSGIEVLGAPDVPDVGAACRYP